jgi:hypothetical protein
MGEQPVVSFRVLQEVFDDIWQELEPRIDERDTDKQRSKLARHVIMAYQKGLKPEEIKAAILKERIAPKAQA